MTHSELILCLTDAVLAHDKQQRVTGSSNATAERKAIEILEIITLAKLQFTNKED